MEIKNSVTFQNFGETNFGTALVKATVNAEFV